MSILKSGLTWKEMINSKKFLKFIISMLVLVSIEKSQIPWILIKNSFVGIYFVDTKYLLEHSLCVSSGLPSLYAIDSACSSVPYIYGFLPVFIIHVIQVSNFSVDALANLQFVLAIAGFSYFASTLKTKHMILFILVLMSPPISLLFERGNLDLIIVCGLFLVSHFFNTGRRYTSLFLATVLALLKFYPACIFAILLFGLRKEKVTKIEFMSYILASSLVVWNFSLISRSSLPSSWDQSYGVGVVHAFSKMSGLGMPTSVILVVLIVFLVLSYGMGRRFGADGVSLRPEFYIFGIVYVVTYLAGFNYDYRLFALIIPSFCLLEHRGIRKSFKVMILMSLFVGLFLSNPAGLNIQGTNQELIVSGITEIINIYLAIVVAYFFGRSFNRQKK